MSDTPYQPITCADYDIYEIAIMQGHLLSLKWRDDSSNALSSTFSGVVTPLKLEIKAGAEYLFYESEGMGISKVRLDKILHAEITPKPEFILS